MIRFVFRLLLPVLLFLPSAVPAADWPQWRYDAGRGASTPHVLAETLHPQWTRDLPPAQQAWPPTQPKLQFDRIPEPVAAGGLLFVPSTKPFDLFDPTRRHRVKLYVKRVFITDECEGLVPPYLRFIKGIIDSEDLPLNVSREMLQNNPLVAKIRKAVVKRILGELNRKAAPERPIEQSVQPAKLTR